MIIKNGYIIAASSADCNYSTILAAIQSCPTAPEGFVYRLKADDLTWELYELPPVEAEPEEISDEEAFRIIMGVGE